MFALLHLASQHEQDYGFQLRLCEPSWQYNVARECLKPANIVLKDVALPGTGCEIIDDNVGVFGNGAQVGDATSRTEKE